MVSAESSSDATVRAFFAVELSPEARSAADGVAHELRAGPGGDTVRWVRPENYHVTLCFLGDIPRSRIRRLTECAAVAIASAPSDNGSFEMCLGEVQAFPSLERPRVVTLDITPHAPLEALASSIERGSERAGVAQAPRGKRTGGRSFRSHLTLGRVRRGRRGPSLVAPRPTAPVATQVKEVVLFRSELSRTGATYTRMERIPLRKLRIQN
jgi:2'-5' RNA ligase